MLAVSMSHGAEQSHLLTLRFEGGEFNARAMWAEAANDPAAAQLDKWIGTANRAADDGLVKNLRRPVVVPHAQ